MKRLATLIGLMFVTSVLLPLQQASGETPADFFGYITMDDGVQLRYSVDLPSPEGRYPIILNFAGYDGGVFPDGSLGFTSQELTSRGYAVVGVSARGSGCSGGSYSTLLRQRWAKDENAVIDWLARQSWSTGKVGLLGESFSAVTQWTGARKPSPHLAAMVPLASLADPYRDTAFPGGIENYGFFALWAGIQNGFAGLGQAAAIASGDLVCAENVAARGGVEPQAQVLAVQEAHPYDSRFWLGNSAERLVRRVKIPTLAGQSWQDDAVGSRVVESLEQMVHPRFLWFYGVNGGHDGPLGSVYTERILRFFDRFLMGDKAAWQHEPRTTLYFDAQHETDQIGGTPAWSLTEPSFPPASLTRTLRLHGDGIMNRESSERPDSVSYDYPLLSPSVAGIYAPGTERATWLQPATPGGQVAFTTPRLRNDAVLYGAANAKLWVRSTAPDTDIQVTLTEVRPDGLEVYLTRGWLRASHRATVPAESTPTQPFHSHTQDDARPLRPGKAALMQVELRPVAHALRKGSALRLIVDAPTGSTGTWAFDYVTDRAINSVLTDGRHPSSLVVNVLAARHAIPPQPVCGLVMSEACRPDVIGVPTGSFDLRKAERGPV